MKHLYLQPRFLSVCPFFIFFHYWPWCSAFWDWLICERCMLSHNESLKINFGTDLTWEVCLWTLKTCLDRQHTRFGNKLHSLCLLLVSVERVGISPEKLQHATSSSSWLMCGGALKVTTSLPLQSVLDSCFHLRSAAPARVQEHAENQSRSENLFTTLIL